MANKDLQKKIELVKSQRWEFDIDAFLDNITFGYMDFTVEYILDKLLDGEYEYYKDYRDFLNDVYFGDKVDVYDIIQLVLDVVNEHKTIHIGSVEDFVEAYFSDYVFIPFEAGLIVLS